MTQQKVNLYLTISVFVVILVAIISCSDSAPELTLQVKPTTEVETGQEIAIVARVEPLEKLDLTWSVSGTAEGILNTYTGEQVIFTANKEGTAFVVAEGTTADDDPVKQTVSLTVVSTKVVNTQPPPDTPATQNPARPATCQSNRPPLDGQSTDVTVEIKSPEDCENGLPKSMTVSGTYSGDLADKEIWVLLYPTDLKYYPQTLDACKELPSNASGEVWNTRVNFGGPPQQYDLVALVIDADGKASREFKRWLQNGCKTGDFTGYLGNELPVGLSEADAITVSTSE